METLLFSFICIIFVGMLVSLFAHALQIPSIVPLLLSGILLGPEVFNLIQPQHFGDGIQVIISLCLAIILFEAGLTLKIEGYYKAPLIILKLLTIGVLITWLGSALLIHLIFKLSISFSLLAGSLIIVTGPTVVTPLLRKIHIKDHLYQILHWESVVIDPIGVFIAILCFEWLIAGGLPVIQLEQFTFRVFIGISLGSIGGYFIYFLLKKGYIPMHQANTFVLAAALLLFSLSNIICHEAGILSVVIAGLVIGWKKPPFLKNLQRFKSEITELVIAIIFILLSTQLKLSYFTQLGWNGLWIVLAIVFLIRPLNVFCCTFKSSLKWNERLFISWIAPRGVITASMASLFAMRLANLGHQNSTFLVAFAFSIIGFTVFLQGLSSGLIAKLFHVKAESQNDWLIIGAHLFARKIADFIQSTTKARCILVDTNANEIAEAQSQQYLAFYGNALSEDIIPVDYRMNITYVLALTDNRDFNELISEKWSELVNKENIYRWSSVNSNAMGYHYKNYIWWHLEKPSQITYNLKNRNALMLKRNPKSIPLLAEQIDIFPLISFDGAGLDFNYLPKSANQPKEILFLQQLQQHLLAFLTVQNCHFFKNNQSLEEILTILLEHAQQQYQELPIQKLRQNLLQQHQLFPTILKNGIAVPHIHCAEIIEPLCLAAILPNGIQLQAPDQQPTKLIFLLLSPDNTPEIHLILMAEIAKLAANDNFAQLVSSIKTKEEFIQMIKNEEI